MKYSKFCINIFSFIITGMICFIFILLLQGVYSCIKNIKDNNINEEKDKDFNVSKTENIPSNEIKEWNLKIESIKLNQGIKEGIDNKVIFNSIGHYGYTDNNKSNICLLGYTYGNDKIKATLSGIKELHLNDVIEYKINELIKHYKVRKNIILEKNEINEYINTFEEKNILKIFGYIQSNDSKVRYIEAVEFN